MGGGGRNGGGEGGGGGRLGGGDGGSRGKGGICNVPRTHMTMLTIYVLLEKKIVLMFHSAVFGIQSP